MDKKQRLQNAYELFNARQTEPLLEMMTGEVAWPNGWEGGYVQGRDAVREYWLRQWKEVDPTVIPEQFTDWQDGRMAVAVHQVVKDLQGNPLINNRVLHIYSFDNDLISTMQIEPLPNEA